MWLCSSLPIQRNKTLKTSAKYSKKLEEERKIKKKEMWSIWILFATRCTIKLDVMGGSVIRSDIKHSDDTYCGTKISEVCKPMCNVACLDSFLNWWARISFCLQGGNGEGRKKGTTQVRSTENTLKICKEKWIKIIVQITRKRTCRNAKNCELSQVKCKGMKKSEMHIVSYSDGTEVIKDVDKSDDDDDNGEE